MSIEERYDEVRQLIAIGKNNGYLLYDEVNELLPSDITSSDELDELFNTLGSAGIEIIDSDQKYLRDEHALDRTAEDAPELELDLTAVALDKTNDPVRRYLREIGTVPLLTRESEGAIARRIERGKRAVLTSISRTPLIARKVIALGDQLHSATRRSASSSSSITKRSPTSGFRSALNRCRHRSTRSANRARCRRNSTRSCGTRRRARRPIVRRIGPRALRRCVTIEPAASWYFLSRRLVAQPW